MEQSDDLEFERPVRWIVNVWAGFGGMAEGFEEGFRWLSSIARAEDRRLADLRPSAREPEPTTSPTARTGMKRSRLTFHLVEG